MSCVRQCNFLFIYNMINKKLLIISSTYNTYTDLIIQKINQTPEYGFLQKKLIVLYFEAFPRQIDISFDGSNLSLFIQNSNQHVSIDQLGAVWYCFPPKINTLHLGETTYTFFIEQQFKTFLENLYYLTCEHIPWIHSPILENKISNALWQALEAQQCGLMIPSFLVTNQSAHALTFARHIPTFCLKNLWHHDHDDVVKSLTTSFAIEKLTRSDLERHYQNKNRTPLYIQEYVDKKSDVYCVVINRKCFTYAMSSSHHHIRSYPVTPHILPKQIETAVLEFVKRQGVFYALIHLLYTKENQYFFLTSNISEQWLWFDIALETERLHSHFIGELIRLFR